MSVMPQLDLLIRARDTRCGNCGRTEEKSGNAVDTVVIDRYPDLICTACVASFDWSEWDFDPLLNVYWCFRGAHRATVNEEYCGADDPDGEYTCTAQAGHSGDHAAFCIGGAYRRWEQ